MNNISLIFSLLFFSSVFIYLYFGIYIIKLNSKAKINRVFLASCISMSIWSFGFGMCNFSQSAESFLFWRRVAALGWSTIYSLMLHFFILLPNKNLTLKVQRTLWLLYIPSILNIYVYSISNKIAILQYNIVKTDFGWTNKVVYNGWNSFFNVYYISYSLLSILAIWKWQSELKDKKITKQAKVIIASIFTVLILGTFTDIAPISIMSHLPQMAPVLILLTTWAMYHSARYHGVINFENKSKVEIIASEEDKRKMLYYISIVFFISGILNFIFEYTMYINDSVYNLKLGFAKSIVFLAIGGLIHLIQRIKKEQLREFLTIVILVFNIPLITLYYLKYASKTVWVYPIIIIMVSLIFSKRLLLISATIFAILSQILLWKFNPEAIVVINHYDYIARIGFFFTAFTVGSYVNNIYVKKIKENEYKIKFKNMHSAVSSDFVTISQKNSDSKINNLLCELGLFFEVDRTYLFSINEENSIMNYSHEWCNKNIKSGQDISKEIKFSGFSWWLDELKENNYIYIDDVSKMTEKAINEKEELMKQDVKSIISIPVEGTDGIQCFIGIDSVESIKKWTSEDIEFLNILSNLIADGLIKIKSENEINFMAYYDNLTKLPNRFLFSDKVNESINLAKNKESLISVIFLDLDNFKTINDTIGHKGGDYLLKEIANRLVGIVEEVDIVSRFGGDEFMILINNINDLNIISDLADKIMGLFKNSFDIEGHQFRITASAGISIYPVDGICAEELTKNADIAMYKAKDKGKNQYVVCNSAIKEEVKMNQELSNDLYKVLEKNELVVYYQPQVDLGNKSINGAEALLRWKHPERGMIPPSIFIPIAEKNGTINKIGEWVLKTACAQNKKWQDMGISTLLMAVNLSAVQFIDPKIADNIASILEETDLNPKYLELEITESMAIKEVSYAEEILTNLKKIGVRVAIDDFGTEYSSLSRLKMLPIDRIKIDMQFVQGIEVSEKDKAITMIIINLAKSLGLNVLAEGVETVPQLDFLNQKMCDDVQGYYYYKPMPAEELENILLNI